MTDKKAMRSLVRHETEALEEKYIEKSDAGIYYNLISIPEYSMAKTIFTYYSVNREPDTVEIIKNSLAAGKQVYLPISNVAGVMDLAVLKSIEDIAEGMYGIPEPSSDNISDVIPDISIVPALAYDRQGIRLGHGGGYYDRFLSTCSTYKIGLCRERLLYEKLPSVSHDIPVDCIITENKIVRLN